MHHAVADPGTLVALDGGEHLLRHRHGKAIKHRAVVAPVLRLRAGVGVRKVRIDHFAAALDGAEYVAERSVVAEHHPRVVVFVNVLAHCRPFTSSSIAFPFHSSTSPASFMPTAKLHANRCSTTRLFPNHTASACTFPSIQSLAAAVSGQKTKTVPSLAIRTSGATRVGFLVVVAISFLLPLRFGQR